MNDHTTPDPRNDLQKAIDELSQAKTAEICGVTQPSVFKWRKNGRLPRTEWTGETRYAETISEATHGHYTRAALLQIVEPEIAATEAVEQFALPLGLESPEEAERRKAKERRVVADRRLGNLEIARD